jgi:hypothetical protein
VTLKSFTTNRKAAAADAPPPRTADVATAAKYPSATLPRIAARVSRKSERRIRELALDEDVTVQQLIVQGLSEPFVARGLEPLDEAR